MSETLTTEADEATKIRRQLSDQHHEAVHLAGLIEGIEKMVLFALRDQDTAIAVSIEHAVGAAKDAGQKLVNELEYLADISTRPA